MKLQEMFISDRGLFLDGEECPPTDQLWESAHGDLDRTGNEQVVLHTARCPACAEGWRLARKQVPVDVPAAQPAAQPAWWSRTTLQLAVAAVVLSAVALGVGLRMITWQEPTPPVYRTPDQTWLESTLPQGQTLSRSECVLRWTAGPEGTTYDVRVTTATLEPLMEVWRIDRAELLIEQETLKDLPAGSTLFWRVTAHPADGRVVRSRTFRTQVQ